MMATTPRIQIALPRRSEDEQEFEMNNPSKSINSSNLREGLQSRNLDFAINTECTSLCLSSSGNFLWAGFSDGTLRVFDLSGRFSLENESWQASRQKSTTMVASKFHQRFGAVACQIHARGVHTDLLMQVDACGDYVFGGVPRGAMELYAVSTKELEDDSPTTANILDKLHVHVHADAKLKGFGACAQLQNAPRPTYLLLTGKGIKNIHIWKFQPPLDEHDEQDTPVWEQLYDTQTNGNTISLLGFYRSPIGKLMGVSQSDTQKLRLWDLSWEEQSEHTKPRPKRPPHLDVANSQGVLGIAGKYGVCGGPTMYNQLSIVSLDQPKSAYNHTELALPATSNSTGRQRRGDLKQVVSVATLPNDSNHALLELDDGSIVHYTSTDIKAGRPRLEILTQDATGIAPLPADFWRRTLCLGQLSGVVAAAVCMYNPNTQMGHIQIRAISAPSSPQLLDSHDGCIQGPPTSEMKSKKKRKRVLESASTVGLVSPDFPKRKKKKKLTATTIAVEIPPSTNTTSTASLPEDKESAIVAQPVDDGNVSQPQDHQVSSQIEASPDKDCKTLTPENVQEVSPSIPLSKSNETDDKCDFASSDLIPPQVSPSASTPTNDSTCNQGDTPSSADSNRAYRGSISKYLKPKRVLHHWNDKDDTPERITNIASPKVPRKKRKTSDETRSTKPKLVKTNLEQRSPEHGLSSTEKVILSQVVKPTISKSNLESISLDGNKTTTPKLVESTLQRMTPSDCDFSYKEDVITTQTAKPTIVGSNPKQRPSDDTLAKMREIQRATPLTIESKLTQKSCDDCLSSQPKTISIPTIKLERVECNLEQRPSDDNRSGKMKNIPVRTEKSKTSESFLDQSSFDNQSSKVKKISRKTVKPNTIHSELERCSSDDDPESKMRIISKKTVKTKMVDVSQERRPSKMRQPPKSNQRPLQETPPSNTEIVVVNPTSKETVVASKLPVTKLSPKEVLLTGATLAPQLPVNKLESERRSPDGSRSFSEAKISSTLAELPEPILPSEKNELLHGVKISKTEDTQIRTKPSVDLLSKHDSTYLVANTLESPNPDFSIMPKKIQFGPNPTGSLSKRPSTNRSKSTNAQTVVSSKKRAISSTALPPEVVVDIEKRQRDTKSKEDSSLANIASLLVDLKSPPTKPKIKPNRRSASPDSCLTRDEVVVIFAKDQYEKLRAHIDSLPKPRSRLLTQNIDRFGSFPSQSRSERILNEHCAAHSMIQKRLLHSAEATLRSLVHSTISAEAARSELTNAIRSFEEVLHDTLKRQELELESLWESQLDGGRPNIQFQSLQSTFDVVQGIYESIEPPKRPPGRPKAL